MESCAVVEPNASHCREPVTYCLVVRRSELHTALHVVVHTVNVALFGAFRVLCLDLCFGHTGTGKIVVNQCLSDDVRG